MAAEGRASLLFGSPLRQRIQKIFRLSPNAIFGASGSVGTMQKCRDLIKNYAESLSKGLDTNTKEELRQSLLKIMKSELDRHKTPHGDNKGAPLADILICVYEPEAKYRIWHIAPDCAARA